MDALTDDQHGHPAYLALDERDRSLVRAILMAVLRYRQDLEVILDSLLERPLPQGANSLRATMHVAMAQILFLDVPAHSAVDLAVESAAADPRNKRFSALVNAITRRVSGSSDVFRARIAGEPTHGPDWFQGRLADVYGAKRAAAIATMHRHPAAIDITLKDSDDAATADALLATGDGLRLANGTIRLKPSLPVTELPGFADGLWWVQDAAAAIPAMLFGDLSGQHIADMCAAPGGKTAQLVAGGARVTALEKSGNRARRLRANMERLGFTHAVDVVVADLFGHDATALYDGVLLDAPCSSTGTVRRHPDVPWTKTPADIAKLADLQARMLDAAARHVKPGGVLVFSNCSLDPDEGEAVAAAFSESHADSFEPVDLSGCHVWLDPFLTNQGRHVRTTPAAWPHDENSFAGMDGFFAACFRRLG